MDTAVTVRLRLIAQLIRLPSQTGTLLLMVPTLWALILASHGRPDPMLIALFAFGSFLMRSAGVILNDAADRRFDSQVERTKTRPLASGALALPEAAIILLVLLVCASGLLLLLNQLALRLSPVALLLAILYPFAKRIFPLPQAVLGIAFGWGVVMAWAAAANALAPEAWLLFAGTIAWAVAYDTIYALQDRTDDERLGIKSSAILFGKNTWLAVAISFGTMAACLALAGWLSGIGVVFYGVLAACCGFVSQQAWTIRNNVSAQAAFAMFRQHVWIGWAILAGFWIGFL
ncbi:MAG: 4-hydroxybenzoate octaprenyltransferase [Nitrospira sp.]|nr:4-hydroxybenzoate octaprenyltransferase [Nitrospira sp.]